MSAKKLSNPFSTCPRRQDKVSQGDWIYAADAGWRQSGNVRLLDNSIPPPPLCGFSKAWKTSPWHICIAISHIGRIYAHTYISVALWHLITCGRMHNCEEYASKICFLRDKFYFYDLQMDHLILIFWYCNENEIGGIWITTTNPCWAEISVVPPPRYPICYEYISQATFRNSISWENSPTAIFCMLYLLFERGVFR